MFYRNGINVWQTIHDQTDNFTCTSIGRMSLHLFGLRVHTNNNPDICCIQFFSSITISQAGFAHIDLQVYW
jgi:hypothetical protein